MADLLSDVSAPVETSVPVDNATVVTTEAVDSLPEFLKGVELDPDIAKEKSLLQFKNIGDLAKSYVSAKKFLGADKLKIPTSGSSEEEWADTFKKLGLPESPDKYEIKLQEGAAIDKDFVAKFAPFAHKNGLLPKQAQATVDFYNEQINETVKQLDEEAKVTFEKNKALLKEQWGEAYSANISKANYALKELGGADMSAHLSSLGVASDARLLSFLAKVGQSLSGDNMPGIKEGSGGPMTPEQASVKMDEIRAEMLTIRDASSPKYMNLVKEQERIAKFAYPTQMTIFPADGE